MREKKWEMKKKWVLACVGVGGEEEKKRKKWGEEMGVSDVWCWRSKEKKIKK